MPGYTKFDNALLEKVLTSDLTKRQLKILLLIVRFSSGCQKTYAVLRRKDFAYAGISPYCVTGELEKLARLRVIGWDPTRDLVWVNPDLEQWRAARCGGKPGENLRRFFKIANKNLLKWQMSVYQNGKPEVAITANNPGGYKEKKENIKKVGKENTLLKLMTDYFLKVGPLGEEETVVFQHMVRSHGPGPVREAIRLAAERDLHSFAGFLKVLDQASQEAQPVRRQGMESLGSALARRRRQSPRP